RRRHTRSKRDWSSDVCSSDLAARERRHRPAAPHHRCGAAPVSSPRTQRGRTDMTQTFTSPIPVLPQPEDGRRVLLKLSGEAFGGGAVGVDPDVVSRIAGEIAEGVSQGVECAVVVGGGNFFRGAELSQRGMDRRRADYMGMLGTVMNCLALQDFL